MSSHIQTSSTVKTNLPGKTDTVSNRLTNDAVDGGHRTTDGSFHSAREDQTAKISVSEAASQQINLQPAPVSDQDIPDAHLAHETQPQEHPELDELGSPSDASTPERPLVRKSSLTFAALPAREPLKSSIGARISHISHVDPVRQPGSTTYPACQTITAHQAAQIPEFEDYNDIPMHDVDHEDDDSNIQILGHDSDVESQSQTTRAHSKASTKRLHEKIDMLGKPPPARPSKSIPATVILPNLSHGDVLSQTPQFGGQVHPTHDDDDDWIKPLTSTNEAPSSPAKTTTDESDGEEEFDCRAPELIAHEERMRTPIRTSPDPGRMMPGFGHTKSASTATLASPAKAAMAPPASPAKSISVSNPAGTTTTPQGSPRRYLDLSASKSKLQSLMKTAKGLFTSSASISAAAKLETLSPQALKVASSAMPGMYPSLTSMLEDKALPPSPPKKTRKTRSSTERENEEKRREKEFQLKQAMDDQLDKARADERKKAAEQKLARERLVKKPDNQPAALSPNRQFEEQEGRPC